MMLNGSYYEHTVSYNTNANLTTVTYARGSTNQVYVYDYDASTFFITSIEGPATNIVTSYDWSGTRNVTETKVSDEATGEYLSVERGYDNNHNVSAEAVGYGADGTTFWSYVWHPTNETLTSITDPEQRTVAFEHVNAAVSKIKVYDGEASSYDTTFSYTTNGLCSGVTNANGHWAKYYYSSYGYCTSVVSELGPTVSYEYSTLGHLTNICLPGASGTRVIGLDVNELGLVQEILYPNGESESFTYDAILNMTNHVDTAGRVTRYTYAPTRKLTSIVREMTGGIEATNSFTYDQQFNTLNIKDALGRLVEAYQLDIQDRPVTVTNVESQTMTVLYGVADYVHQVTRFDGTVVTNQYDSEGHLAAMKYPGSTNTFSFYKNSLLKTVGNELGTITNLFSGANRLTNSIGVAPNGSVSYAYLSAGQVSSVASVLGTVSCSFDAAERVASIQAPLGSFTNSYNVYNGLLAEMTCTDSGVRAVYSCDVMDRLTNIVWYDSATNVLRSFAYQYSSAGMITNVTYETTNHTAYTHDDLDQLTGEVQYNAVGGTITNLTWQYDLVGNRTNETRGATVNTYILGTGNRLSSWGPNGTDYSVYLDSAGCVTSMQQSVGAALTLSWNGLYQLTEVKTNGVTAESYQHDAMGRRVSIASGGTTNWMVMDGVHVIAEVDSSGNLQKSYTWGMGIDNLLSFTTGYGTATTNTYYCLTDHLGTVHAVTDGNGSIVESYTFNAWGQVVAVYDSNGQPLSESLIGNRYLWQGREYSWKIGLYHFRARSYDPITGRWLSKDPIGISAGPNMYEAFANNAVMMRDPSGLDIYIFIQSGHVTLAVQSSWGKGAQHSWQTYSFTGTGNMLGNGNQVGQVAANVITHAELIKRIAFKTVVGVYRVATTQSQDKIAVAEILRQAEENNAPTYGSEGRCEKRSFQLVKKASGVNFVGRTFRNGVNSLVSGMDKRIKKDGLSGVTKVKGPWSPYED